MADAPHGRTATTRAGPTSSRMDLAWATTQETCCCGLRRPDCRLAREAVVASADLSVPAAGVCRSDVPGRCAAAEHGSPTEASARLRCAGQALDEIGRAHV